MTMAVISDIHGNLDALTAVLADIARKDVERVVCLGDVVSFGPSPGECVDAIASIPEVAWVRGNHDRYIGERSFLSKAFVDRWPAGFVENEQWTHSQLSSSQLTTLATLPPSAVMNAGSVEFHFFHATETSDEDFLWGDSTAEEFEGKIGRGGIRVYGHIHHQYARTIPGTVYLNPGSVGFPFDGDPSTAYALIRVADESVSVELVRIQYTVSNTIANLERNEVPWIGPIRSALEKSLSFFSPEVKAANDSRQYEVDRG